MKTVRILILYRVDKNNKNIIIIIVDEILVEKRTPVRYNTRVVKKKPDSAPFV